MPYPITIWKFARMGSALAQAFVGEPLRGQDVLAATSALPPPENHARLPFLEIDLGLGQPCYFPRLSTAAIPIDLRMTKCDETQRKVAAIEALRVPSNGHDRPVENAAGQIPQLAAQAILRLVCETAAQS